MDIKKSLTSFYDMEAEKYYHTRNKHRADAHFFLEEIKKSKKKTIHILEFGCGSGRFLAHLGQLNWVTIKYTWVDISQKLLSFAKKQLTKKTWSTHISATFVCDDIVNYITGLKQESFDFVIWIASFQHIPTKKQRFFLMKNIYRILHYDGKVLMSNWSFSRRFIKKHLTPLYKSLLQYLFFRWKPHIRNDLIIPRTNKKTLHQRYYHIYTISELKYIFTTSGFDIETIWHIRKWSFVPSRHHSQNSLIIGKKSIFLKNESN